MYSARLFCLLTEIILSAIATVYQIRSPGVCAVTGTANLVLAICMTFGTLQIQDQSCKHVLRSHWTGPNQTTDLRNWGVLQIQDRSPQLRPVASECVCNWCATRCSLWRPVLDLQRARYLILELTSFDILSYGRTNTNTSWLKMCHSIQKCNC